MHNICFELDNLFCEYGLGAVYVKNPFESDVEIPDDYVTIHVLSSMDNRFLKFWGNAQEKLGKRFGVSHIQEGALTSQKMFVKQRLYFIHVKCAELLLKRFDDLLPSEFRET